MTIFDRLRQMDPTTETRRKTTENQEIVDDTVKDQVKAVAALVRFCQARRWVSCGVQVRVQVPPLFRQAFMRLSAATTSSLNSFPSTFARCGFVFLFSLSERKATVVFASQRST